MKENRPRKNIEDASIKYQEAAKKLMEAVRITYPVGTTVNVSMGRSRFAAEVVGHNDNWWYKPADFYIRNLVSGKRRTVSATFAPHNITIIDRP